MRNDSAGQITAAAECPVCHATTGTVCTDTRTGRPFAGQQVHTERLHAANCTCMRVKPDGNGPWHIIPNPRCNIHGEDEA